MLLGLIATVALGGCSNLPKSTPYQRPDLALPEASTPASTPAATTSSANLLRWWNSFQDPVLDALLAEAAGHNQDLALASARILEARATLDQNRVNFFPTVDLNGSAVRRRVMRTAPS